MRCVICGQRATKVLECRNCHLEAAPLCDGYLCRPALWALGPHEPRSVIPLMNLECEECPGRLSEETLARRREEVARWLRNMMNADRLMSDETTVGFALRPLQPKGSLATVLARLEQAIYEHVFRVLSESDLAPSTRRTIRLALQNPLVCATGRNLHENQRPILVFRFFTGQLGGLRSASQAGMTDRITRKKIAPQTWNPDRARGTATESSQAHQRGVKSGGATQRLSDVVSTTCSLRNLVLCSAGAYQCTPGGGVMQIIFGNEHLGSRRDLVPDIFAPKVALILLPPGSYICDWRPYLADPYSDSTASDVSYFEREVSYDTWGSNNLLSNELILGIWVNPFRDQVQPRGESSSASRPGSFFGGSKHF